MMNVETVMSYDYDACLPVHVLKNIMFPPTLSNFFERKKSVFNMKSSNSGLIVHKQYEECLQIENALEQFLSHTV